MKKAELWITQRIFAVLVYTAIFVFTCYYFNGNSLSFLTDSNSKYNLIFVSGALLLVFWSYIGEPFFTKPVDVLTNCTAIILALLSVNKSEEFIGYEFLLYSAWALLFFSILVIFLSQFRKIEAFQKVLYEILTKLGQSKITFSFIYIFTIFSYFRSIPIQFAFFLTFWAILVTQFVVEGILLWISRIIKYIFHRKEYSEILGQAIWCENPFLYKIEVDFFKHNNKDAKKGEMVYLSLENDSGAVGIVINEKQLLNKKWITVYLLEHENSPLKINFKTKSFITGSNTIFSQDNAVYSFNMDELTNEESKKQIEENYLYRNKDNFVWYITDGSDINKCQGSLFSPIWLSTIFVS